ncbi:MAG: hypothetical protein M5U12_06935 [Verrucomicrobia bacterium]|nr:hypothetical protein [Verrucomicrobiota bacterium]
MRLVRGSSFGWSGSSDGDFSLEGGRSLRYGGGRHARDETGFSFTRTAQGRPPWNVSRRSERWLPLFRPTERLHLDASSPVPLYHQMETIILERINAEAALGAGCRARWIW